MGGPFICPAGSVGQITSTVIRSTCTGSGRVPGNMA